MQARDAVHIEAVLALKILHRDGEFLVVEVAVLRIGRCAVKRSETAPQPPDLIAVPHSDSNRRNAAASLVLA